MTTINISDLISELLFFHECVIIPDVGAFIKNYESAKINPSQHLFHPPSKKIVFNGNIKNNDGLLANYISETYNTSFTKSINILNEYVSSVQVDLKNSKQISFKNIGSIFLNTEGNIQFIPDQSVNYHTDSYGLTSIISLPVKRETKPTIPVKKFIDRKIKKEDSAKHIPVSLKRATWISVPVIVLMIWATFSPVVMKTVFTNYTNITSSIIFSVNQLTSKIKMNSLSFHIKTLEKKQTIVSNKPVNRTALKVKTIFKSFADTTLNKSKDNSITIKKNTSSQHMPSLKPYHIVGGCFKDIRNADYFVKVMNEKGFESKILDTTPNGLYRVTIAVCQDETTANQKLQSIRSNGYSAWILQVN